MLVSEIKKLFLAKFDAFQSGYISNAKLNQFYFEASTEVWKDLAASFELSSRITEDANYLLRTEVITPTNALFNIDALLTEPYNTLINIYPKYTTSRGTIQYPAKPFFEEEKLSEYAQGTIRYPRFDVYTDSNGERQVQLYPEDVVPTEVKVMYFAEPYTIDFDTPTYNVKYSSNTINLITDKAVQLASAATRDSESFQESSILINQANTVQ